MQIVIHFFLLVKSCLILDNDLVLYSIMTTMCKYGHLNILPFAFTSKCFTKIIYYILLICVQQLYGFLGQKKSIFSSNK